MKNIITLAIVLTIAIVGSKFYNNESSQIDNIVKDIETKNNKKIIVAIMNSNTGKIVYINREKEAIQYEFEPKSIMIPIVTAIAIENNKITQTKLLPAHNFTKKDANGFYKKGKLKIGIWTIKDEVQFKKHYLSIKDIVTNRSYIGIAQLSNKLNAKEFLEGFYNFGFNTKTSIDLENENIGQLPSYNQLRAGQLKNKPNIFKATASYGLGMKVTFMQLLKAYNVFNNNGEIITPYIKNKPDIKPIQIISKNNANTIKSYLQRNNETNINSGIYYRFFNVNNIKYTIGIVIINSEKMDNKLSTSLYKDILKSFKS